MALACDDATGSVAPSYFIFRDIAPGEPFDPTVPLSFWPPKDSDDLFDALRAKYPHVKSHSDRMRDAMIEFLLEERQGNQYQSSSSMVVDSITSTYHSNGSQSHSSSSVLSSPELMNFATPPAYYDNSPLAPIPSHQSSIRQQSISTSSGQPSPPQSLDQMTGVFSLSSGPQPKQRVRRKMTEAEKVEYRKRRIVKACNKCAQRKRKCHHNQPEMESVGHPHTSTLGHKVAKSFASALSAKSSSTTMTPVSQQETESFLGHPFLNSAEFDFSPHLADIQIDFDLPVSTDEPFYPAVEFDDIFCEDVFQFEADSVQNTSADFLDAMPEFQAFADAEFAHDLEGMEPIVPNWPVQDGMGARPVASSSTRTEHITDDRRLNRPPSSSTIKGRTVPGTWWLASGPLARGATSCNRLRSSHPRLYSDGLLWQQQRDGQDDQPVPNDPAHFTCEPCPDMENESSGYGSSTSSDQDAIYEALPLDWRGYKSVSQDAARSTGASGDRGLPSTSVAVSGGAKASTAPIGRPRVPAGYTTAAAATRLDTVLPKLGSEPRTESSALDSVDPSAELYRLRRRITTNNTHQTFTQLGALARQASNARLMVIPDAQALRLAVLPRLATTNPLIQSTGSGPVHTRPRNPSDASLPGDTNPPSHTSASFSVSSGLHTAGLLAGPHPADLFIGGAGVVEGEEEGGVQRRSASLPVCIKRLRDTKRYKDHHGRPIITLAGALVPLLLLLLLTAVGVVTSLSSMSNPGTLSISWAWIHLVAAAAATAAAGALSSGSSTFSSSAVPCSSSLLRRCTEFFALPAASASLHGLVQRASMLQLVF